MAGNIQRGAEGKASLFKIKGSPRNPLGGMRPDGDPTGHGPTDFVFQKNIRRVGGLVVSRGGQGAFVDLDAEPLGMVDFQGAGTGLGGIGAGAGLFLTTTFDGQEGLYEYSLEQSPRLQPRVAGAGLPGGGFYRTASIRINDSMRPASEEDTVDLPDVEAYVIGSGVGVLYRINSVDPGYGIDSNQIGTDLVTPLLTIPEDTAAWEIFHIVQVAEKVFILASTLDAVIQSAFAWDGISLVREYDLLDNPDAAIQFRDSLVVFDGGDIVVRADAGNWSVVTTTPNEPATPRSLISYRDNLYYSCPEGTAFSRKNLYRFDGATVTTLTFATTGVANENQTIIYSLAVLRDVLYYVWGLPGEDPDVIGALFVGKYDGSTWNAEWKDLLAQFPAASDSGKYPCAAFQDSLYVAAVEAGIDAVPTLFYQSFGASTDGTWARIPPPAAEQVDPTFLEVH